MPSAPRVPSPVASSGEATPAPSAAPLARGRELTALLYQDQLDQLWEAFLPSARAQWGDLSAFKAYRATGLETYGAETSVLNEAVLEDGDVTSYARTVTFAGDPGNAWVLRFSLDAQGDVSHFEIVPADTQAPQ
ncbi:hypothetical protein [Deinococcus aluminii]|uniref:Nuclear transport factor 2 family protein n=1 Tax=Deinococcus aluminii TaxID=1656885 RepID=A0ABP9XBL7_9DEIO